MKNFFYAIFCALCISGCSPKSAVSPTDYTKEYASALQRAVPELRIAIKADMEIAVTTKDGHETTTFLDNSYKEYLSSPGNKAEVIQKYVSAFLEPRIQTEQVDRTRITPVIKDRAWLSEIKEGMKARGAREVPENVWEPLNDELVVVYVEDSPKNLRYLSPKDVPMLSLKVEELRPLAVKNLRALSLNIQIQGGNGIFMITAGGDYEASLILFDEFWDRSRIEVDGDYVIAVPSRDMLLITGSRNRTGIEKLRGLASKVIAEAPYRLTADLFVYRDGKFSKFKE